MRQRMTEADKLKDARFRRWAAGIMMVIFLAYCVLTFSRWSTLTYIALGTLAVQCVSCLARWIARPTNTDHPS
jgi:uncharacterized membrane protein